MENINRIKGIIFDYGGTIDSRGDHWSHIIAAGYEAARVELSRQTFRDAYVYAERALARTRYVLPHFTFADLMDVKIRVEMEQLVNLGFVAPDQARAVAPRIARYCYEYARECVEEAKPVLERLAARYPMVLVSNFYGNVEAVLEDFGIRGLFRSIVESAVVGVRKPDPAIFGLGVEALGLRPEEVLVVGDSLRKDILPAESLGCATAWIKGRGWTLDEDRASHPSLVVNLGSVSDSLLTFAN